MMWSTTKLMDLDITGADVVNNKIMNLDITGGDVVNNKINGPGHYWR